MCEVPGGAHPALFFSVVGIYFFLFFPLHIVLQLVGPGADELGGLREADGPTAPGLLPLGPRPLKPGNKELSHVKVPTARGNSP